MRRNIIEYWGIAIGGTVVVLCTLAILKGIFLLFS
jgi:hypothetical protein